MVSLSNALQTLVLLAALVAKDSALAMVIQQMTTTRVATAAIAAEQKEEIVAD